MSLEEIRSYEDELGIVVDEKGIMHYKAYRFPDPSKSNGVFRQVYFSWLVNELEFRKQEQYDL